MRKLKITFGRLLVVILVIGVAGVFIDYANKVKTAVDSIHEQKIADKKVEEIKHRDWLTYENKDLGFSIQYPQFFYIPDQKYGPFDVTFFHISLKNTDISSDVQPRISIYAAKTGLEDTVKTLNEQRNKDQFPEYSEININSQKAYQTKALDPKVIYTQTIIGDDKKSYIIELFTTEQENPALVQTYDLMLKSFNMLK